MQSTDEPSGPYRVEFQSNGMDFAFVGRDPHEYIIGQIASAGGFYENDLLEAITYLALAPQAYVFDVGANIGNHTVFFAKVLERNVIAFEPHDGNLDLLTQNVALNQVADRVTVRRTALGEFNGQVSLQQTIENNSGTFHTVQDEDGEIPVERLDDAIDIDIPVGLIKIDTEGDELAVLHGATQTLERWKPTIVVEVHDGKKYREIAAFLGDRGYQVLDIKGRSQNVIFITDPAPSATRVVDLQNERAQTRRIGGALDKVQQSQSEIRAGISATHQASVEAMVDKRSLLILADDLHRVRLQLHEVQDEAGRLKAQLRAQADIGKLWKAEYNRVRRSRALRVTRKVRGALRKLHFTKGPTDRTAALVEAQIAAKLEPTASDYRLAVPPKLAARLDRSEPTREPIRIGIATMPERVEGLRKVVDSLYDQADEICVYLNEFDVVPEFLNRPKITAVLGPDIGDRGKFYFFQGFRGYYVTVDDDIEYPPFYVQYSIDGVERYGRRAVVGWHGSILKDDFEDYYDPSSRQILSFSTNLGARDTFVHLLGTGTTTMHTDTIDVTMNMFEISNIADVFFALHAQRNAIPLVVLSHRHGWARPIDFPLSRSISGASMEESDSHRNVRMEANRLVSHHQRWKVNSVKPVFVRDKFDVEFVGRTHARRWTKGGILKSAHLTASMLNGMGIATKLIDIADGVHPNDVKAISDPKLVIIYTGDPDRPDFATAEDHLHAHAEAGRAVLINLSYNLRPERTAFIVEKMQAWDAQYPGLVHLMTFSDRSVDDPLLSPIRQLVFPIPKTIELPTGPPALFHETRGIFVGDYGKLCNDALLDFPVEEWLAAIRRAVPGEPIVAVRQYAPAEERDFGIEVIPYLAETYEDTLSRFRVMVSPFRYCTFEMVPVELAAMGVPVLYREMEQSLSEYLGSAGIGLRNPAHLEETLPAVYQDQLVWSRLSHAGVLRASSYDQRLQQASLYLRLHSLVSSLHTGENPIGVTVH